MCRNLPWRIIHIVKAFTVGNAVEDLSGMSVRVARFFGFATLRKEKAHGTAGEYGCRMRKYGRWNLRMKEIILRKGR